MSSSALARRAKDASYAPVEALWSLGFTLARVFYRPQIEHWVSPGGQRVLVIAPHPDDEVIGCAGTIILHKQHGDTVWVVYITDGRGSRALGLGPQEMARRRKQEAEAASELLNLDRFVWFGLAEGSWTAERLGPRLQSLLDQFAPDILYVPSRIDFHPDHHQVAACLADLLPDQQTPLLRVYQIHVLLTPILTNLVADTTAVIKASQAARDAYVTQFSSVAKTIRLCRYAARFYGFKEQAEEFWHMTAHQYRLLHTFSTTVNPIEPFWGVRFHPLSDPLAYLRGLSERRRLIAHHENLSNHPWL